jgi:hypothetical protein
MLCPCLNAKQIRLGLINETFYSSSNLGTSSLVAGCAGSIDHIYQGRLMVMILLNCFFYRKLHDNLHCKPLLTSMWAVNTYRCSSMRLTLTMKTLMLSTQRQGRLNIGSSLSLSNSDYSFPFSHVHISWKCSHLEYIITHAPVAP